MYKKIVVAIDDSVRCVCRKPPSPSPRAPACASPTSPTKPCSACITGHHHVPRRRPGSAPPSATPAASCSQSQAGIDGIATETLLVEGGKPARLGNHRRRGPHQRGRPHRRRHHGRSGIGRLIVGSVAEQLIKSPPPYCWSENTDDNASSTTRDEPCGPTSACSAVFSATPCASRMARPFSPSSSGCGRPPSGLPATATRRRRNWRPPRPPPRDTTQAVVRAFSYFLQLANIAEDQHHIRRRRAHDLAHSRPAKAAWTTPWMPRQAGRCRGGGRLFRPRPHLAGPHRPPHRGAAPEHAAEPAGNRAPARPAGPPAAHPEEQAENDTGLYRSVLTLWQTACCADPPQGHRRG